MLLTLEEVVIAAARIAGSLPVLRWPFAGGVVAVLVDFSDLFMMNLLDLGGVGDYQAFDKWLDQAYMLTFLVVALRWKGVPRHVAIGLFGYRLVGFAYFELIDSWRGVLLFFPNVFEFWFLFVAGLNRVKPDYEITRRRAALWLPALTALKVFQEYALHWGRWFDGYAAMDVVADWWQTITSLWP